MAKPRTGDGYTGGQKPGWRDLFFRRDSNSNKGLTSDIQPLATERFRRSAGKPVDKKPPRKSRWF